MIRNRIVCKILPNLLTAVITSTSSANKNIISQKLPAHPINSKPELMQKTLVSQSPEEKECNNTVILDYPSKPDHQSEFIHSLSRSECLKYHQSFLQSKVATEQRKLLENKDAASVVNVITTWNGQIIARDSTLIQKPSP